MQKQVIHRVLRLRAKGEHRKPLSRLRRPDFESRNSEFCWMHWRNSVYIVSRASDASLYVCRIKSTVDVSYLPLDDTSQQDRNA